MPASNQFHNARWYKFSAPSGWFQAVCGANRKFKRAFKIKTVPARNVLVKQAASKLQQYETMSRICKWRRF
jgi:hypothetical protein